MGLKIGFSAKAFARGSTGYLERKSGRVKTLEVTSPLCESFLELFLCRVRPGETMAGTIHDIEAFLNK